MDRRTIILVGLFGAFLLYGVMSSVVYPTWIQPLTTLDARIADRQNELDKLRDGEAAVSAAKEEYRRFVERVGSFDSVRVENRLRERLTALIGRYQLAGFNVSTNRGKPDKKTGLIRQRITVQGTTPLESAIGFLKEVAELPELVRVANPAIYPARSSRKDKGPDRMFVRVPIETMVLPPRRLVGLIREEDLVQPDSHVRHAGRDYSAIAKRTPFRAYVQLKPLVADAGPNVKVRQRGRAKMRGGARGGDGKYTHRWTPAEGLTDPSNPRSKVDTSVAFTRMYTLTVTDGRGKTATSSTKVTVEGSKQVADAAKPTTPLPAPRPKDRRWKNRRQLLFSMALMRSWDDTRIAECMIYNARSKETTYYSVGDEFDGGELVFVHQRGAIVRRQNGYFVYAIGNKLDRDVAIDQADQYPMLQAVGKQLRLAEKAKLDEEPQGDTDKTQPHKQGAAAVPPADVGPKAADPAEKPASNAVASDGSTKRAGEKNIAEDADAGKTGKRSGIRRRNKRPGRRHRGR